jgi:hypothetical protein
MNAEFRKLSTSMYEVRLHVDDREVVVILRDAGKGKIKIRCDEQNDMHSVGRTVAFILPTRAAEKSQ